MSDAPVSGNGDGRARSLVARAWSQLAKSPIFTVAYFVTLGALVFVAVRNHEPVSTSIGMLSVAFYGGGAWKNHADMRYGNGYHT